MDKRILRSAVSWHGSLRARSALYELLVGLPVVLVGVVGTLVAPPWGGVVFGLLGLAIAALVHAAWPSPMERAAQRENERLQRALATLEARPNVSAPGARGQLAANLRRDALWGPSSGSSGGGSHTHSGPFGY